MVTHVYLRLSVVRGRVFPVAFCVDITPVRIRKHVDSADEKKYRVGIRTIVPRGLYSQTRLPSRSRYIKQPGDKQQFSGNDTGEGRNLLLQRVLENPIIEPSTENRWESDAVFNSGAILLNDKVHLIYRAIGESGLSVFGYASSANGIRIDERTDEPAFVCHSLSASEEKIFSPYPYLSGGSWWGCEDPRIAKIEDRIYMTYTAFDGCQPPCVAVTSIDADDFLNKRWKWKQPRIISKPGQINKNWVIFPEKINGKFAVLHSISPSILISYVDSLDFDEGNFIESHYQSSDRSEYWDNWVRGVGPPPIKTEEGWLLLYHAMDTRDPDKYKLGAMILDAQEPEKILYRSLSPLLEPASWYENNGHKRGVIYSCGAVIVNEKLYVYYGGSDKFICLATVKMDHLLNQLKTSAIPATEQVSLLS